MEIRDNRGKSLAEVLAQKSYGWPRTPHRLAFGISCYEEDDHEPLIKRAKAALRGKKNKVLVIDNCAVSAYCSIDE